MYPFKPIPEESEEHFDKDEDGHDDVASLGSDLSSAPSMSRQCTEFSEVAVTELMSRQCSDFATKQTEFWKRKCTEPVFSARTLQGPFGSQRQTSCPAERSRSMFDDEVGGVLSAVEDRLSSLKLGQLEGEIHEETAEDLKEEEEDDLIAKAICAAVNECDFSVTIADPTGLDNELIAVSSDFEVLTGYSPEEAVGENCRFLNEGCPSELTQGATLRAACDTGAPFTSLVVNRRKSGEFFLNLLDLRSLVIARCDDAASEIVLLIGVQRDLRGMTSTGLPADNLPQLEKVARRIHKRLMKNAAALGISGAIKPSAIRHNGSGNQSTNSLHILSDILWKPGKTLGEPIGEMLARIPSEILQQAGFTLVRTTCALEQTPSNTSVHQNANNSSCRAYVEELPLLTERRSSLALIVAALAFSTVGLVLLLRSRRR